MAKKQKAHITIQETPKKSTCINELRMSVQINEQNFSSFHDYSN